MKPEIEVEHIRSAIAEKRVRITKHADEEAQADQLKLDEIYFSVQAGEIIAHYPEDRPYPSCLIYGRNIVDEPIHSVWAYNQDNQWAVLITVYRPDPSRWINFRIRVEKSP